MANLKNEKLMWLSHRTSPASSVGSKAANLFEMTRLKLPVPDGFVIPYNVFNEFLEANHAKDKFKELLSAVNKQNLKQSQERLSKIITSGKFPPALLKNIELNFKKLKKGYKLVSVRSSANCEDSEKASFAGQFESFLSIHNMEKLLEAIKACWASPYRASAMSYAFIHKVDIKGIRMAVIIQGMVQADKAGVMFTENIWHSHESVVIEAAPGMGEKVVAGLTNPDRYMVDKSSLEVIHKELSGKGILSKPEIRKLVEYGLLLERHFKAAQDVEWAIKAKDIFLLQTRPITK
jgi:pyruvate,water dikinase